MSIWKHLLEKASLDFERSSINGENMLRSSKYTKELTGINDLTYQLLMMIS
jgi:hypothetical protein